MLLAILANVSIVLTHPPPVIIHLSYDGSFCSCNCELAATASKQTPSVPLLHTTHCCGDLLPTMGESVLR